MIDVVKAMILLPFVGTVVSLFIRTPWTGVIFSGATFILSVFTPIGYQSEITISEYLGFKISLYVDGLNILLVLLTTFLFFLVFLYSLVEKRQRKEEYVFLFLLLEALVIPVFLTKNILAFYFFFDATLIPMFFIIGVWGTGRKIYSAYKFVFFTFFGGVFFLVSAIYIARLVFVKTGVVSFELEDFIQAVQDVERPIKIALFLGFFIAFAVKIPLVPVHVWLPDAHTEAPTGGSVILAGILLKIGSYAFLRFAVPIFPDVVRDYAVIIAIISVLGIVYGAFLALAQQDIKRLIAYSSVSHMGYVMLGSVSFVGDRISYEGLQGAVLQMINHGIATGALFFLVGMIYERTHSRMIEDYSGIARKVPIFTALFFVFTLSSIGFPSTGGFIGELFVVIGAIKSNILIGIITAAGAILSAGYMLYLVLRVFFGELKRTDITEELSDIRGVELFVALALSVFVFLIGIFPSPFMEIVKGGIEFVWKHL